MRSLEISIHVLPCLKVLNVSISKLWCNQHWLPAKPKKMWIWMESKVIPLSLCPRRYHNISKKMRIMLKIEILLTRSKMVRFWREVMGHPHSQILSSIEGYSKIQTLTEISHQFESASMHFSSIKEQIPMKL